MDTAPLGYGLFDCDNHFYEQKDSFSRYIEPAFRDQAVSHGEEGGVPRVIDALSAEDTRKIMRDNGRRLLGLPI